VIDESADDIGTVPDRHGITHTIKTGDAPPQVQKPYKIASCAEEAWLKAQLEVLLRLGVTSPSTSAWMSPVVLVKKKNGDLPTWPGMHTMANTDLGNTAGNVQIMW
jgi:hypothetical protein